MKRVLLAFVFLPFFAFSQGGVHFEKDLTWQQVKEKAKAENKYIFIDCFATWCGPCKLMDKEVYPVDSVGEFVNKNFVSVKVQCDTSRSDDDAVKKWYADAHEIVARYTVQVYPTFLFLSPDGQIVHEGMGYLQPADFVKLSMEAMDPSKQYFTLVREYEKGKRDYSLMPRLAARAKKFKEIDVANRIAEDYTHNYLDKLSDAEFCTKDNFSFLAEYRKNIKPGNRVFEWYVHHSNQVDSVMQINKYSSVMINYVAYKEEVTPELELSKRTKQMPDWKRMEKSIEKKFGKQYCEGNLLTAKVNWYGSIEDWKNYSHFLVMKLERDSIEKAPKLPFNALVLNNDAWDVFQHSENTDELKTALKWSDLAIGMVEKPDGNYFDTKANLLYKLGSKQEAVALQTKAAEMSPKNKEILDRLEKMQNGKPTW